MIHKHYLLGALGAFVFLAAAPALATVMVEVSLEDMTRDSVGVVRARVVSSGVQMNIRQDSYDPTTITRLEVEEWIVGQGESTIHIREFGGEYAGGGLRIAGTPEFSPGEEVVLFLDRDVDGLTEYYRTYAMVQGKFTVRRGVPGVPDVVLRDTEGVSFAEWHGGEMVVDHGHHSTMQLARFVERVREIAELDGRVVSEPGQGVVR